MGLQTFLTGTYLDLSYPNAANYSGSDIYNYTSSIFECLSGYWNCQGISYPETSSKLYHVYSASPLGVSGISASWNGSNWVTNRFSVGYMTCSFSGGSAFLTGEHRITHLTGDYSPNNTSAIVGFLFRYPSDDIVYGAYGVDSAGGYTGSEDLSSIVTGIQISLSSIQNTWNDFISAGLKVLTPDELSGTTAALATSSIMQLYNNCVSLNNIRKLYNDTLYCPCGFATEYPFEPLGPASSIFPSGATGHSGSSAGYLTHMLSAWDDLAEYIMGLSTAEEYVISAFNISAVNNIGPNNYNIPSSDKKYIGYITCGAIEGWDQYLTDASTAVTARYNTFINLSAGYGKTVFHGAYSPMIYINTFWWPLCQYKTLDKEHYKTPISSFSGTEAFVYNKGALNTIYYILKPLEYLDDARNALRSRFG